jgi:glycosyltransferase involved in cell wall biosynthesis
VFPEGSVLALAAAARLVLTQPRFAAALGEKGRLRAIDTFTWKKVAADRYRLYQEVLRAEGR